MTIGGLPHVVVLDDASHTLPGKDILLNVEEVLSILFE
jgi:hypothetical protein